MKTEKIYNEVLEKIKKEASGFVGASIVDMESGMPLATQSTRDDFDLGTASAYNSEMVKMKLKTMEILGANARNVFDGFARHCPPASISRAANARQFLEYLEQAEEIEKRDLYRLTFKKL